MYFYTFFFSTSRILHCRPQAPDGRSSWSERLFPWMWLQQCRLGHGACTITHTRTPFSSRDDQCQMNYLTLKTCRVHMQNSISPTLHIHTTYSRSTQLDLWPLHVQRSKSIAVVSISSCAVHSPSRGTILGCRAGRFWMNSQFFI